MATWNSFQFTTSSPEDAQQFVTDYLLDATARIADLDGCETPGFAYGRHPETGERSVISMTVIGDADKVIESEKSRWHRYQEEGLLDDWEKQMTMEQAEVESINGEKATSLVPQINSLTTEMARTAYEHFDPLETKPAAVDTFPDEDAEAGPVGWWTVLHILTVQLNYTLDEELDAYLRGIEHTLRNFAEYEGGEAVDERLDTIREELDRMQDEVKEGRPSLM